jgi:DNA-binding NtrC family response regulator
MTTADYQPVKVLALTSAERDQICLQHILDHTSWTLWPANNIQDAVEKIQRHRIPVVITSEYLPDGDWKTLLSQLQSLPEPPEVILMTAKTDEHLWAEVLKSGAYDLIAKPFDRSEVFRIVSLAWRQWRDLWYGNARVRVAYKATA